jgi:hypothetical protein
MSFYIFIVSLILAIIIPFNLDNIFGQQYPYPSPGQQYPYPSPGQQYPYPSPGQQYPYPSPGQQGQFQTVTDEKLGISIGIPSTWVQQPSPSQDVDLAFAEPSGIAILTISVKDSGGVSIDVIADGIISGMQKAAQNSGVSINLLSKYDSTSDPNAPGRIMEYGILTSQGMPAMQGVIFITLFAEKIYVLNFMIEASQYTAYAPIIQQIVSTSKIISNSDGGSSYSLSDIPIIGDLFK